LEKIKIKILLIEDKPGGSLFWEQILDELHDVESTFIHIEQLSDFSHMSENDAPDIILLDLSLPEGRLELFLSIYQMAPSIPIVVITETEDQKLAVQTALEGAQDCLVKRDIGSFLLGRSMRYAISRQKHLKQEKAVSNYDELTGLHNRRGFLTLAEQQIKIADQVNQSLLMIFADVDGLKTINDNLGHHWGDLALMEMAHVLREAFRETDSLARLSGDEFVALLICENGINEEFLIKRFQETLEQHNTYPERHFMLSASMGIARYDPRSPCSVAELMVNADAMMYQQKKPKKGIPNSLSPAKEPVSSILRQFLAETNNETVIRLILPLIRTCEWDEPLLSELCSWMTKGSPELKLNLLGLMENMNHPAGGPVLQTAIFDQSEEIAARAARAIGRIHFTPALKSLLQAAVIWETRAPDSEIFVTAVCQAMGDLAQPEGVSFLQDIVREIPLRQTKNHSLSVRLAAVKALSQLNEPDTWLFLENLAKDKNSPLQEPLQKLLHERHSA